MQQKIVPDIRNGELELAMSETLIANIRLPLCFKIPVIVNGNEVGQAELKFSLYVYIG